MSAPSQGEGDSTACFSANHPPWGGLALARNPWRALWPKGQLELSLLDQAGEASCCSTAQSRPRNPALPTASGLVCVCVTGRGMAGGVGVVCLVDGGLTLATSIP